MLHVNVLCEYLISFCLFTCLKVMYCFLNLTWNMLLYFDIIINVLFTG